MFSDYDGRSPLHIAAAENHLDLVNLFLKWNADVNILDNYDSTPLSDALNAKHWKLAKYLYSKGGKLGFLKTRGV